MARPRSGQEWGVIAPPSRGAGSAAAAAGAAAGAARPPW